jgi:signal transduction histidine kinase/CheY-like chemotaxis protein
MFNSLKVNAQLLFVILIIVCGISVNFTAEYYSNQNLYESTQARELIHSGKEPNANVDTDAVRINSRALQIDRYTPFVVAFFFLLLTFPIVLIVLKNDKLIKKLDQSVKNEIAAGLVKDQFLANVNHELRTPLTSVIGYAELLRNTQLNDTQRKFLQAIHFSGEALSQVINNVLDFAKLDSGTLKPEPVIFDTGQLMDSIELPYTVLFANKGVSFSLEGRNKLPANLRGDAVKVKQILLNLVGNAHKFTERGSVTMRVEIDKPRDGFLPVKFSIEDTGIGINEADTKHIFERFYQADKTLQRKHEGTGLGLAIVWQLVTLLKGKISVISKLDRGSTFSVQLPFELTDELAETHWPQVKAVPLEGCKALVVDDNTLNRELLFHLLTRWGVEVTAVSSGKQAFESLNTGVYDLILLDIQMPDVDGYQVARHIRKILSVATPIIALSGHSSANEKQACFQAGMNDFISKPFDEASLYRSIVSILNRRDSAQLNLSPQPAANKAVEIEKKITDHLQTHLPLLFTALRKSIAENNAAEARVTLHNLRNNLSVFNLANLLEPHLQVLVDAETITSNTVLNSVDTVEKICFDALEERIQRTK